MWTQPPVYIRLTFDLDTLPTSKMISHANRVPKLQRHSRPKRGSVSNSILALPVPSL